MTVNSREVSSLSCHYEVMTCDGTSDKVTSLRRRSDLLSLYNPAKILINFGSKTFCFTYSFSSLAYEEIESNFGKIPWLLGLSVEH